MPDFLHSRGQKVLIHMPGHIGLLLRTCFTIFGEKRRKFLSQTIL